MECLEQKEIERPETGHADLFADVQGMRMHYVRAGEGRPLVMIHGLTGSTANWGRNIEALSSRAEVYALDLINMGQSDRQAGLDASLSATADRVAAWMDAVGLDEADIAGHSHGGAVAMMLAARHPDRVRSLMLFAPANPYSRLGDRLVRIYSSLPGRLLARIAPFLPRPIHMIALGRMYGDPSRINPGCLEGYVTGLRIPGTVEHVLAIVESWFGEMDALTEALSDLERTPMLLVWGDRDRAVSLDSGLRLHRELSRSQWIVLRGAGHVPFEEMPEECNRIMMRWLERMELPKYDPRSVAAARTTQPARAAMSSGMRQVSGQA